MLIKEFLPNPVGNDKEGEYIKLFNDSGNAVSLVGWSVKDASGKTFNLSGNLAAGQELILPYSKTKIALNNNGEEVLLYDAAGELVDKLNYSGQAEEGQAITKRQVTIDQMTNYPIIPRPKAGIPVTESDLGTNYQLLITNNFLFLDFLTAAILASLGLYIISQLEKKLEIKLF